MLRPQLPPRVGGLRDVLDGLGMSGRVCSLEVERTEIDRFVCGAIHAVERQSDEARFNALPAEVELDRAVREFDPFEVRGSLTGALAQPETPPRAVREAGHAAVRNRDPQALT